MEPPPAPIVWMSSAGSRIGNPPTVRAGAGSGTPPRTKQTSVLVPPMSKVTASGIAARGRDRGAGAHATGRSRQQQRRGHAAASPTPTSPPADVITSTFAATPTMRSRYGPHAGRKYALTTVVTMRSYSRNSGETSLDVVTSRPVARSAAATACSGSELRSEWSSTTATASTASGIAGHAPSHASSSVPSASSRPPTSKRHSRGTSGAGRSANGS